MRNRQSLMHVSYCLPLTQLAIDGQTAAYYRFVCDRYL